MMKFNLIGEYEKYRISMIEWVLVVVNVVLLVGFMIWRMWDR